MHIFNTTDPKEPLQQINDIRENLNNRLSVLIRHYTGLAGGTTETAFMTMNDKGRHAYEAHMDDIMVQNDVLDTSKTVGRAEGLKEGILSVARS